MKELKIEYKVGGLWKRSLKASIPEEYSEMSAKQFHAIMAISRKEITEEKFVEEFYGVKSRLWKQLDKFYLYTLTELLRNLEAGHRVNRMFDVGISIKGRNYYAPDAMLTNMCLQQFMSVDTFHGWYVYDEDKFHLIKFMACLFTPKDVPFQKVDIDASIRDFTWLYDHERWMMLDAVVNWMLVKNWLSSSYTALFPASDTSEDAPQKKVRPSGWTRFFDALVGENLGNIDTYNRLECMDVFRIVNSRIKDQRKKK